jgi:hypothetical protein
VRARGQLPGMPWRGPASWHVVWKPSRRKAAGWHIRFRTSLDAGPRRSTVRPGAYSAVTMRLSVRVAVQRAAFGATGGAPSGAVSR